MSTAKETPLGINVHSGFLQNQGLCINPDAQAHMGVSKVNGQYTFGSLVNNSCLFWLTYAIHDAYCRGVVLTSPAGSSVYDNLITIGSGVCEILGNGKPPTYNDQDPSDAQIPSDTPTWYHENHPGTTGYAIAPVAGDYPTGNQNGRGYSSAGAGPVPTYIGGQAQKANWYPYNMTNVNNSITQWGFIRCWALQAWNEFNWNGGTTTPEPDRTSTGTPLSPVQYKDFLTSFDTAASFADYNNISACLLKNAPEYLKGVYSNMNDLTSADVLGVSLSDCFGTDCITAGKVIDLSKIDKFGLPSVLLQTIYKNHAMSQSLNLALLSAGLSPEEIVDISNETAPFVTKEQEQQMYGAFLVIVGTDLQDILIPLNCKTPGLTTLADTLDVRKLFPCSYKSITVPVYNTTPGPTNSKTYYPVFSGEGTSPRLNNPVIVEQVGTVVPAGDPPVVPRETPPITIEAEKPLPPAAPLNPAVIPPPSVTSAPKVSGGGCPAPWIKITLADMSTVNAGDLQVGMEVYTKHETTGVWGKYKVSAVSKMIDYRWCVNFDNGSEFIGTFNHRFLTENGWKHLNNLEEGDVIICKDDEKTKVTKINSYDEGEVVKITIEDAHTYLTEGLVSHNVKYTGFGGGCVVLESFVPQVEDQIYNGNKLQFAYQLSDEHKIYLADETSLESRIGQVVKAINELQPCVRIITEDGTSLVCSTTAPIPTKRNGTVKAPHTLLEEVAVLRDNKSYWSTVVRIEDAGLKFVRAIDTGNNSFWAGEFDGAYILHHNTPIEVGDFINKN